VTAIPGRKNNEFNGDPWFVSCWCSLQNWTVFGPKMIFSNFFIFERDPFHHSPSPSHHDVLFPLKISFILLTSLSSYFREEAISFKYHAHSFIHDSYVREEA
jgi:hypothetical protein